MHSRCPGRYVSVSGVSVFSRFQGLLCESEAIELLQVMIFEVELLGSLRQHVSILDLLDFNVIVFVACVMRSQIVASGECFQRKLFRLGTGRLSTLLLICLHPGQCLDKVLLAQRARLAQLHRHFALWKHVRGSCLLLHLAVVLHVCGRAVRLV